MNRSNGFTLIEVLIAMLVLAVGLLGLAGLQATSLKNNQSAYNRSQATQLAYDLADKMRANVAGLATYTTAGAAAQKTPCLTTTGCSPTDMAKNDLFEWNNAVATAFPSGVGAIAVATGVFTITITWDDDHDGVSTNNPNFQTSFQL